MYIITKSPDPRQIDEWIDRYTHVDRYMDWWIPLYSSDIKQTWKGFSPVCTNWCLFSFELSTNAFPHSAHTCTLGPWVCKCFLMAAVSRNNLLQPCKNINNIYIQSFPKCCNYNLEKCNLNNYYYLHYCIKNS